ncbi:hypothetical protein ASG43_03135 [Aureimonas sp. Leaf454]|nr:hypothetical protein ASG43_03135 [Aureimonas sp. Leaf454]
MAESASRNRSAIAAIVVVATFLGAWFFRFEAIPNARGYTFLKDRIFGQHRVCYPEAGKLRCEGLTESPSKAGMFDDLIPKP